MIIVYIVLGILATILLLAILIKPKGKELKSYAWNDPLDPACITTDEIVNRTAEILVVHHDVGHGGWQFYDGQDVTGRSPKVILKNEILMIDDTLNEIINLEAGYRAERKFKGDKWDIRKI